MRFVLTTILLCFLAGLLNAANQEAGVWEVLEDCSVVQSSINDGDSFLIQYGNETDVFRLYYVDAPETNNSYPDRVHEQASYFSISTDDAITSGELATQFTKLFLQKTFTIYTKWEDARGSGRKRYYAMVKNQSDGRYLSMELIKNGLARIYGMPTKQAWPDGYNPRTYLSRLKNTERQAQRDRTGIWAVAGSSQQMAGLESLRDDIEGDLAMSGYTALAPTPGNRGSSKTGMINVNTATSPELETLPGIGPALALRITQARPIDSIEALVNVSGISDNKLRGFRSLIIVAEPPPPAKTVDFFFAELETYLNTEITLSIASVSNSDAKSPDSFRSVELKTAFEGQTGGSITAYIPDEFYDSFIEFYSTPGRELSGLLYDRDGDTVLVYQRK